MKYASSSLCELEIGFADGFWGDDSKYGVPMSRSDLGARTLLFSNKE